MSSAILTESKTEKGLPWCREDTLWVLGIYGTAVGSGSLFWPISLGLAGFWPMLILSLLSFPMTYLTYRALARLIQAGSYGNGKDGNILDTVDEFLGPKWGKFFTFCYFATVFPAATVYTITVANTLIDLIHTQLGMGLLPRYIAAPLVVGVLTIIGALGVAVILRFMALIVFPFIISLVFFGIVSIPYWNPSFMTTAEGFGGAGGLLASCFHALPMVVFAFSFTSIVSSFVVAQKKRYGSNSAYKVTQILFVAVAIVVVTVVFFAWSSIFALSPAEITQAKVENLTVLSFLARKFDSPALALAPQIIVFFAATKAFFAQYLATEESIKSFARMSLHIPAAQVNSALFTWGIALIIFLICTATTLANFNVLKLIKVALVPVSIFIAYYMPQYAFYKVPALAKYRGGFVNWFILAIGTLCLANGLIAIFWRG